MRFISSLSAAALLASSGYAAPTYFVTDVDILQFALTVSLSRTRLVPADHHADVEMSSSNIWRTSFIDKPSAIISSQGFPGRRIQRDLLQQPQVHRA